MPEQTAPVEVTVYSRERCHLCAEAIETLERVAEDADVAVTIEEVDIDEDPELRGEYGDRIPYVVIEGRPAFKFRVDPEECRDRLQRAVGE